MEADSGKNGTQGGDFLYFYTPLYVQIWLPSCKNKPVHNHIIQDNFGVADIFPEGQILKMGKTAMKLLEMKDEEFYEGMGVYFVTLATDLGYGLMLQSVGRRFRDFFVNLDNLHDYLKFTFQRMKAPSFFIADETPDGMVMEYRSKRRGFQYYVQGQVKEISKNFALEIKKLEILLKKQEVMRWRG